MPTTIHIPHTLQNWPWPRCVNRHYEQCKEESTAWLNSFRSGFSPRLQKAIDTCDLSLAGAMAYATLSDEGCRLGCDLIGFYAAIDEITDELDAAKTGHVADIVMDSLRNSSTPRPWKEGLIGEMARQFRVNTARIASDTWIGRFLPSVQDYMDSVVQQSAGREKDYVRSVDSYLQLRRRTIASWSFFMLCEIDINIPPYVMENDAMKRLTLAATDMMIMDNDMFSYNREQAFGEESHNLVTCMMHEFGLTIQEAFNKIGDMHNTLAEQFLDDMTKVPSWGGEVDLQVKTYIDRLGIFVMGNYQWSFETVRYFGKDADRVFRERTVQLLPKVKM